LNKKNVNGVDLLLKFYKTIIRT
jgi:hypothetical protein